MCSQEILCPAAEPPPVDVFAKVTPLGAAASGTMAAVARLPSRRVASCCDVKYSMPQSVWWI